MSKGDFGDEEAGDHWRRGSPAWLNDLLHEQVPGRYDEAAGGPLLNLSGDGRLDTKHSGLLQLRARQTKAVDVHRGAMCMCAVVDSFGRGRVTVQCQVDHVNRLLVVEASSPADVRYVCF